MVEGDFTEVSGYLAMQRLLPYKPEAVFCGFRYHGLWRFTRFTPGQFVCAGRCGGGGALMI